MLFKNPIINSIILLFIIILSTPSLKAQIRETGEIVGKVISAETEQPIEFATLLLANTSMGALSQKDGSFRLSNIPTGTYHILCALVGYQMSDQIIKVTKNNIVRVKFVLNAKPINIKEINVIAQNPLEWQRNLRRFEEVFLGESSNAEECEITNPEIIDFNLDKNTYELKAFTDDPIIIMNKALGYKLTVYLEEFSWSRLYDWGEYSCSTLFEELKSEDPNELTRWKNNREKIYYGSLRYFLKSCVEKKVYENGFRLIKSGEPNNKNFDNIGLLLDQNFANVDTVIYRMIKKVGIDEYSISYNNFLHVLYLDQKEDHNYMGYRQRVNGKRDLYSSQSSWIKFPNGSLYFNSNGICDYDQLFGKALVGYWAWERISDLLPYDYEPPPLDKNEKSM